MSGTRHHTPADRCAVYRLFDNQGRLLYIGISHTPDARIKAHRRSDKPWRKQIGDWRIEWYDDLASADAAEWTAIRAEQPLYNVVKTLNHPQFCREAIAAHKERMRQLRLTSARRDQGKGVTMSMDEPYGLRYPSGQPVTGWEAQVEKFRHRPVVVEAFGPIDRQMVVSTPQGPRMAEVGDYIVTRGSANEMWPIRPWVFEYVYEPAPAGTPVDMSGRGPRG